jgi:hypothetical protein
MINSRLDDIRNFNFQPLREIKYPIKHSQASLKVIDLGHEIKKHLLLKHCRRNEIRGNRQWSSIMNKSCENGSGKLPIDLERSHVRGNHK